MAFRYFVFCSDVEFALDLEECRARGIFVDNMDVLLEVMGDGRYIKAEVTVPSMSRFNYSF